MKNNIHSLLALLLFVNLTAQVRINVNENEEVESAMLQIDSNNAGLSIPNIQLTSLTSSDPIVNPASGLIIYNTSYITTEDGTLAPGFFCWQSSGWKEIGKINDQFVIDQPIDTNILGYVPTGITETDPATFVYDNVTYTKLGCKKWNRIDGGNGHTYCAYRAGTNINWEKTFQLAKSRGGYMVTLTSDIERTWVRTNIINNSTGYNLSNRIWVGYNKFRSTYIPTRSNQDDQSSGNKYNGYRYQWITGEQWIVSWDNSGTIGARVENVFATNYPNIKNSNGCAYIGTGNSTRYWYDASCTTTTNLKDIIVEFQE